MVVNGQEPPWDYYPFGNHWSTHCGRTCPPCPWAKLCREVRPFWTGTKRRPIEVETQTENMATDPNGLVAWWKRFGWPIAEQPGGCYNPIPIYIQLCTKILSAITKISATNSPIGHLYSLSGIFLLHLDGIDTVPPFCSKLSNVTQESKIYRERRIARYCNCNWWRMQHKSTQYKMQIDATQLVPIRYE